MVNCCSLYSELGSSVCLLHNTAYTYMGNPKRVMCVQIASQPTTVMNALNGIIAEGGLGALFRGLGAASVRVVPMALVSFGTYEFVRSQYMQLEESWALAAAEEEMKCCISSKALTCEV